MSPASQDCSTRSAPVGHAHLDRDNLISVTLVPPPKECGVTHWSSRLLAQHLGARLAWRDLGIQPWRAEAFKFSSDP
jgi:hypothetical protein